VFVKGPKHQDLVRIQHKKYTVVANEGFIKDSRELSVNQEWFNI
jgi:hypothetical protein